MKSIQFDEATNKIAEHQKEYNTLISQWNPDEQSINVCFDINEDEFREIAKTRKIWYKQLTFGRPMNPMRVSPFKEGMINQRKDVKDLNDIDTTTPEGQMLFSALVILTTENRTESTPFEVMEEVKKLWNDIQTKKSTES